MRPIENPVSYAAHVVNAVFEDLYGRAGFDDWWDDIDEDTRFQILLDLQLKVSDELRKDWESMGR